MKVFYWQSESSLQSFKYSSGPGVSRINFSWLYFTLQRKYTVLNDIKTVMNKVICINWEFAEQFFFRGFSSTIGFRVGSLLSKLTYRQFCWHCSMSTSLLVAVREYFLNEYFFSLPVKDRKYPQANMSPHLTHQRTNFLDISISLQRGRNRSWEWPRK